MPEITAPELDACTEEVVDPVDLSEDTMGRRAFNDTVVGDPGVVCAQLPVRDGMTLVRRAGER
jgi:hypothetical protein